MSVSEQPLTSSPTAILNSGVLPPIVRRKRANGFKGIIVLISGIVLMLPVIAWIDRTKDIKTGCILLLSALVLTITVHEVGHLVAGWMVGFRFAHIGIWPFSLNLEQGEFKPRVRREMLALGSTGMSTKSMRRLHRRLLIFIVGGPAANLLFVLVAVLLVKHVFTGLGETELETLVAQLTFFSLLVAITSLIPTGSLIPSDGTRIVMLLRSPDRSRRWISIYALGNLYCSGVRPRDWKRTWLRSASSVHDNSVDTLTGEWLAYAAANDRMDVMTAAAHLEKCLELAGVLPQSARDALAMEAAFFTAWFRDDTALASLWLTQLKKPRRSQRVVRLRLDVALHCVRRDYDAAECSWREGFELLESATSGGARQMLKEASLDWREEILKRKTQQVTVSDSAV